VRDGARLETSRTLEVQGTFTADNATLAGDAVLRFTAGSTGAIRSSTVALQPTLPIAAEWPVLANISFDGIDRILLHGQVLADAALAASSPLPLLWAGEVAANATLTVAAPTELILGDGTGVTTIGRITVGGGHVAVDEGATIAAHGTIEVAPGGQLTVPPTATIELDGTLTATDADILGGGTISFAGGWVSASDCRIGVQPHLAIASGAGQIETPGSQWIGVDSILVTGILESSVVTLEPADLPYAWNGGRINAGTLILGDEVRLELNDTTHIRGDGTLRLDPGSSVHVALAGASLAVGRSGEAGRLEAAGAEISGEPGSSLWIEPTGTVELLATRLELQPRLHVDANVDLSGSDAIGVEWIELWGTPADDCVLDAATPLPLRWQGGSLPSGATLTVAEDTTLQLTGALTIDDATLATEPGSVLVLDGATIRAGLTGPGAVLDLGSTTVVRRGWGSSIDAWDGANVTISETTLVDTLLDLRGATALIADSVVTLGETGVEVGSGSSLTVSGTDLTEHSSAAIDAAGAATVDARGCWWGAPDGPGGSAAGSGDPVFGPVVWDPPATTPRRHGSLEAAFSSTPAIAYTDQAVVLNDVSVGAPTAWSWQLGDGATADGPLAVHTYTSAGTYTVELTVSNPLGAATVTGEVTVVDTASPNVLLLTEPEVAWQTSPASPTVGEMVTFTATGRGPTFEHRWDLDGDGSWDSYQPSPRHTYSAPGPAQITLEVVGPTGRDRTSAPLMVSPRQPDAQPWISTLERQYPEAALAPRAGTSLPELWTAVVERSETGGNLVSVSLNGAVLDVVGGSEPQVSHTLDLGLLPVQTTPSTITWTPFDSSGTAGASASRPAWVLPHPAWLSEAVAADPSSLQITPTPAELLHLIRAELPATALSTPVTVPPAAPFLAGDAGLLELTGEIEATVSSLGSGSFALTDTVITATAAGLELSSAVDGRGVLSLLPSSGLVLEHGFLAGTIEGEGEVAKALAAAAPGLADLADLPEVGGAVTRSAVHHEITAALAVTGEALATTAQNHAGSLVVTPFAQPLSATVSAFASGRAASDHLAETVTVAGAETVVGSGTESTLSAEVTTRARFTIDHLLELVPTTEATVTCAASGGQTTAECTTHTVQDRSERLRAVPDDRRRHGAPDRPLTAAPEAVSNVFAGATPVAVATASQTVALWVGHDPTLPQLQSTGILWSATDGAGQWTEPRLIVEDTRLELQPVAAVTTDGQVVAAWLRVRDPLLAATVDEVGDLPLLLEQLEVVTATFDPGTGQWSSPIALTDDVASDGSLRMTVGSDGAVHLAWLRNPAAALVPSPAAPSELLVSRWSDGSWSSPETAATGLADITDLSLAATGDRTWVLLAVDPVAEVSGDERLDMVEGDGGIWTAPTPFLPGEATPRQPRLVTLTPAGGPSVMAAWMCSGEVRMSPVIDPGPVTAASIGAGPGELWLAGGTRPLVLWQRGGAAFLLDASDPDAEPIRLPGTGDLSQQQLTTTTSPSGSVVAAWIASSSGSDRRDLWIDTIEPGPDLVPTAAAAGPQHNPRVTVVNRGPEPSGDFQVWVVDQGQQMLDARLIRGPFASGEHRRVYFSGPLDGPPWTIVVDATDVVPEADESNNATPPIGPSASSENAPPVASAVATTSVGPVPLAVTVDASRSRDPDGDPLTFLWLLPDTVAPVSGPVLSHTFAEPGQWPITLLVRDPSGSFDTGRLEVTVLPTNGQVNGDGVVDAGDLLAILQHLFVRPQPFADVNGSGAVDAADLAHELLLLAEG
jgi:PKD repeat protein